jgi:hypothetical protein
MAAAASWLQSSHQGCVRHAVSPMLMACMAEHIHDLGLTLSRQFICQRGKV